MFWQELFPSLWEKTVPLIQAITQNHIFKNGNKRTAFAVANFLSMVIGFT
ncbi:Fic family protein [Thermoflavimicrobium dichotomicum]